MRQRRVGTLSMGFLLVSSGILLLYAQFKKVEAFELLVKWWPLVFFLLGAEVLLYAFLQKEEKGKISYDVFSIFMIMVIIFVGSGLFALTQTGIAEGLSNVVKAQSYNLQLPEREFILEDSIDKIVIAADQQISLDIRTSTDKTVSLLGACYARADSTETARKLMNDLTVATHITGDVLYIAFDTTRSAGDMKYYARVNEYTVFIPQDRGVEIDGGNYVTIQGEGIKRDWLVKCDGAVITIPADKKTEILAIVNDPNRLKGNTEWEITDNPETGENIGDNTNRAVTNSTVTGRTGTADAENKLSIVCSGDVEVNKI